LNIILRINKALAKGEEVLLAVLLVSMVLIASLQVCLRNIWNVSIDWADITLQYFTLMVAFLGAAIATTEGRHLNIDLFSRVLSSRQKLMLNVLIGIFSVGVLVLLTLGGVTNYQLNFKPWVENNPQGWSVWKGLANEFSEGGIPQWVSLLMFAIGFALIGLHFLLRLICDVSSLITGKTLIEEVIQAAEGDALLDAMEKNAHFQEGGSAHAR
jgi:TRAP-type C4-dicarboxylate transport system permease small subunit